LAGNGYICANNWQHTHARLPAAGSRPAPAWQPSTVPIGGAWQAGLSNCRNTAINSATRCRCAAKAFCALRIGVGIGGNSGVPPFRVHPAERIDQTAPPRPCKRLWSAPPIPYRSARRNATSIAHARHAMAFSARSLRPMAPPSKGPKPDAAPPSP